jgi:hypothetical protein
MLSEADSPHSASLRASAAAVAGPLKLSEAAATLRKMAIDEKEDRRTRLHAIESYLSLKGARARDLTIILNSHSPMVRAAALVAALREPSLENIARSKLQKEKDPGVRAAVTRRVPSLNRDVATVPSPVASTKPLSGRPRKSKR